MMSLPFLSPVLPLALLAAVAAPISPTKLPSKVMPAPQMLNPKVTDTGLLTAAQLVTVARSQGVTPADDSPDSLGTLSPSHPRTNTAWLEARCLAQVTTADKIESFTFQREMVAWCTSHGRRAGLMVHVRTEAGKAYAVNCSGTPLDWTVTRAPGTAQADRLSTNGPSPTYVFLATKAGIEEIQFSFDAAKFTSEYMIDRCRVSSLS